MPGDDRADAALLRRDPAAHVALDDPGAVARLLASLRGTGGEEQTAADLGVSRSTLYRELRKHREGTVAEWVGRAG